MSNTHRTRRESYAALDIRCRTCGHLLTTEASVVAGIGPICAAGTSQAAQAREVDDAA